MRPHRLTPALALPLAAALAVLTPRAAPAAAGDLDPSFGGGTGWLHRPDSSTGAVGMAVQADGKIFVSGTYPDNGASKFSVWRCLPDGSLDTAFGTAGRASVVLTSSAGPRGQILLRSDGRILANASNFLASFTKDGQPDLTWDTAHNGVSSNYANPAALLPDGKTLGLSGLVLSRRLLDGTMDPSWGTPGYPSGLVAIPTVPPYNSNTCIGFTVLDDGKILVINTDFYFSLTKFLPDGTRDISFGSGGLAQLTPQGAQGRLLTILPDGKILVAGDYAPGAGGGLGCMLGRFLPNGSADISFGDPATPGRSIIVMTTSGVSITGLDVQNDGRILVAGTFASGTLGDTTIGSSLGSDLYLLRCTSDGLRDPAFGTAGLARINLGGTETVKSMVLLPDDTVLLAGGWRPTGATTPEILLARCLVPGSLPLIVEHPPGTDTQPWSPLTVDFGPVTAAASVIQLTLRNPGRSPLTNLQAALTDESHPGQYHLTPPATATLAPGASTTLVLSLNPSAPGWRTATLRLTATGQNPALPLPPRLISLTGFRPTPLGVWRYTWFASPYDFGPGADSNDFDGDGYPNFMEYATRMDPHKYSASPCTPAGHGAFTYTRPSDALGEISYIPESAPAPGGPWSPDGLASVVMTDSGGVQTVRVTPIGAPPRHLFMRLRVMKL